LARCLRPRALRHSRRIRYRRLPVPLVPHWPCGEVAPVCQAFGATRYFSPVACFA
jgi:hypothetical protein